MEPTAASRDRGLDAPEGASPTDEQRLAAANPSEGQPSAVAVEAVARVIDEADNRWQHGVGASGYDPDGPPLWLARAVLAYLAEHPEHLGLEWGEMLRPKLVDDGPCNGRCHNVACQPTDRAHRFEWHPERRLVGPWQEVPDEG